MPFPQSLMAKAAGDWQFEVNGLILGVGTPYMVTGVAGLRDQNPRSSYPNRPVAHGTMPLPDYLNPKQIILNLTLPSPDHPVEYTPYVPAVGEWKRLPAGNVSNLTGTVEYRIAEDGRVEWRGVVTTTDVASSAYVSIPAEAQPLASQLPVYYDWTGATSDRNLHSPTGTGFYVGMYNPAGSVIDLAHFGYWGAPPPVVPVVPPTPVLENLLTELARAWAPVLDGSTLRTLAWKLPNIAKRRLYGRCRNFSVDMSTYDLGWVDAVVEFVATDPIAYSDVQSTMQVLLGDPTVGRTYNRTYPMAYGGGTSGAASIVNAGTGMSYPVVTFTGPITNPAAENVTTGKRVSFGITLAAGETLTVDFGARTVILNGTASRYNTMTSAADQWWVLVPGNNSVRYSASAYVVGSAMTVAWRSAWL